jgi:hypothetical protein
MKRKTSLLLAGVLFLATAPVTLAQDLRTQTPQLPSDILGPQLIAWSQLQKPQPVSESARRARQADQSPGQAANPPAEQQPQSPAEQTLTGTIVKDGDRYILKVWNTSAYELDDQDRAKKYEGKQVKVAGTLNGKSNSFHIINIEMIS